MEEIEFSRWPFDGRLRQGKNVLPDGLNWLCYFAGSSKSHRENSISFIFLESPHQVDMKNIVKSSKHIFGYFNTLKTHSGLDVKAIIWNDFIYRYTFLKLICIHRKCLSIPPLTKPCPPPLPPILIPLTLNFPPPSPPQHSPSPHLNPI